MNREETVKFIYDILKKHSVKVNEVDVIPVSSCIALVDDLIEHETNLLKEFVEYLQSTAKYQALCEDIDTMGISWGKRYMSANHQLNQDLEKFLEEKK